MAQAPNEAQVVLECYSLVLLPPPALPSFLLFFPREVGGEGITDQRLEGVIREIMLAKSSMDLVLVPCALAVMVSYHLLLLYRIGYENHSKLAWVQRMAQTTEPAEAALALSVISDGISASTTLASLSIALASLIAAWVSSSESATVKYATLLACFLASFTCFVHFLITALGSDAPASHLQRAVLRGGGFWAAGLRALYLATALFVWVVLGPVAMLACSVLTVALLYLLDSNSVPLHRHQFTARTGSKDRPSLALAS
ncbi:hypothetical protein HU200_029055 [Digitaria exilis]|uniref:Uncharacterized protein n=1 Tax=Digitaria exilis TaxID=1010633 RepID=A0A835ETF7_9POAL|nr:hypothetical protein HU200_029055 [Digitaria exilis]